MRSLIDIRELSVAEIDALIATATDMIAHPARYAHCCDGKKLATLFFEPSTRTRLSFEAAMIELGGHVLTGGGARRPARRLKGRERGGHGTGRVLLRGHHRDAAPEGGRAAGGRGAAPPVPVINAGRRRPQSPHANAGRPADHSPAKRAVRRHLTVGFCGDLKFGRTVHSLLRCAARGTPGVTVRADLAGGAEAAELRQGRGHIRAAGVAYVQTTDPARP